jgi:CHAT domain-containing protein
LTKEQPPRIWWCPTGPLAFLPLHAAGNYGKEDSESILDYAVSSYTPSITSLTNRVKNDSAIPADVSGLFLTCQPEAIKAYPIHGTTTEVRSIHDQITKHGARVKLVEGNDLTIGEGLVYMEKFSSIHLACHASQDQKEPLESQFLFHDGRLTLSQIMQKNLKNADLAFLSACETSTGKKNLSEEAVHLAAGMLAAGYRRVVATMWAIGDQHAIEVSKDFYDYLLAHQSGSGFDGSQSAYALHHAIQKLRHKLDNSPKSLLAWIPYVHFGL